jgi:COMPASS component SWD3
MNSLPTALLNSLTLQRDISQPSERRSLSSLGSISSHTRPVECLLGKVTSDGKTILYTGDTMGIIKVWELLRETGSNPRWKASLSQQLDYHRTRIDDMFYGNGQLWTGTTVRFLFSFIPLAKSSHEPPSLSG